MKIKIKDIINKPKLWLNQLKLFQYDIKIIVDEKAHEVTAIHLDDDNQYIAYKVDCGRSVRKNLDEVEEIIVSGDSEKELKEEISRLKINV